MVPNSRRVSAPLVALVAWCLVACGGAKPAWRGLPATVLAPTVLTPTVLTPTGLTPTGLAPTATTLNLAAIAPPGPGWPWLLGGNTKSGDLPDVGFWHSGDGLTWTRATARGLTLDAPHNLVFSMAHQGHVAIAVGETPGQAHGNPRPTIWRSTDGAAWSEVPTLREDFGGPKLTDLAAVTAGPLGFAVVGNWITDAGTPVIAVWLSADGLSWDRLDSVTSLTSRQGEELTAFSIAEGPAGFAIAGEAYVPTPTQSAHVDGFLATSRDGRSWTRVAVAGAGLDNDGGQVAVRQIVAAGDGFVAIGTRALGAHNEVTTWRSSPPGVWTATTVAAAGFVSATSLAADGAALVAAAVDGGATRLWARVGGRWRALEAPVPADPKAQGVLLASAHGRIMLAVQSPGRVSLWVR